MMKGARFPVRGLPALDGVTIWSTQSLKLAGGPQLCVGIPMTYSSASSKSVMNSVESLRMACCCWVRAWRFERLELPPGLKWGAARNALKPCHKERLSLVTGMTEDDGRM